MNTKFLTELKIGNIVESNFVEVRVLSIESDTMAKCSGTLSNTPTKFNIQPKLDHSVMFGAVLNKLRENKPLAIHPEGRTHENPGVIKFKSGIGSIVYTAIEKGIPLKVYGVGINYSVPENPRMNAYMCISEPITFNKEILLGDKKKSIKKIVEKIQNEVEALVVPMKTYDEVKLVYYTAKLFYSESKSTKIEKLRIVTQKYQNLRSKDENSFTQVLESYCRYRDLIHDFRISKYFGAQVSTPEAISIIFLCIIMLLVVILT